LKEGFMINKFKKDEWVLIIMEDGDEIYVNKKGNLIARINGD
jgi:hypothetical protein